MPLPPPAPGLLDDAALFLDFDGTLVEFAATPDGIAVPDRLRSLLPRLGARLDGRLAIVSGRAVDEIVAHLGLDPARPGLTIAGSHGLERILPDGMRERPDPLPGVAVAADAFRDAADAMPGVVAEAKPFGAAIHWRGAADRAAACDALAVRLAGETGLDLQRGKMVVELRMPGTDKGGAVDALMADAPFIGHRPVFVGDDLTDEAGFRAAAAAGGTGVLVGDRAGTAAACALPDVAAVLDWLAAAAG